MKNQIENMGASNLCSQTRHQKFIYSVPVGPQKNGETRVHRHPQSVQGLLQIPANIKNLADFWDDIVSRYSKNKAIQDITYHDLDKYAKALGSWLFGNKHQKIYLYSRNNPQWTMTDIASWNYGITNIPLYDTLGTEAFFHILQLTKGTAIFLSSDLTPKLVANLQTQKQNLNTAVFLDNASQENKKKLQNIGLKVFSIKDLISNDKIIQRPVMNLDHHITLTFTSGTTGLPKGVIGTHRMAISQCLAMKGHYEYYQDDVHLSFLPVAHSFERFVTWGILFFGANIRYAVHSMLQLTKDLAKSKPTTVPMVPRLLNKFYPICKGILQKQQSAEKIKGLFGGRVRIMVTGSAPINPQILIFFKNALNCDIRQGYGQTQTMAASFITYENDTNYGHVGGPNRGTQFKLVDVPQMNYLTSTDPPRGQICNRGDSIFKGYYLDQKNTKQTIDSQGWNHSGDVGVILPNGALKVIDRKKNIYKLSQGQYIAPQKIQNIYTRNAYVAQCFIYGDPLQHYNVAIIHPNVEALKAASKKLGVEEDDIHKLVKNKQVEQFVLKQMTQYGQKQGLLGFQLAKKIRLWPASFGTLGIFTSTMKLQRHIAKKQFITHIDQMYKEE